MVDQGVIVVGTDTGVGKTRVAAAVLVALRARGVCALPMKPIQTGASDNRAPDLDFCLAAAGIGFDADLYDLLAPYRFPLPASPHLAARAAGTPIEPARILDAFRRLRADGHPLVVEAAGGLLVPLTDSLLQVDLLLEFNLPFLLVARPGLGTLNHTLLSVEALQRRGARLAGVVLNATTPGWGEVEEDNARTLRLFNPGFGISCSPYAPIIRPHTLRETGQTILDKILDLELRKSGNDY